MKKIKKLDNILELFWIFVFPFVLSLCVITSAIYFYVLLDDEIGAMFLNACCLFGVIIISGFTINFIVLGICKFILFAWKTRIYKVKQKD